MLAVIIPSRNASNFLQCARAVRKHEPEALILAIDDGLDLPPQPDLMPCVRYSTGQPFGYSRNCNAGIRLTDPLDIVLLNDDAILETPGGFSLLKREAREHPEYGLIAASTNNAGNRNQQCRVERKRYDSHMFDPVLIGGAPHVPVSALAVRAHAGFDRA